MNRLMHLNHLIESSRVALSVASIFSTCEPCQELIHSQQRRGRGRRKNLELDCLRCKFVTAQLPYLTESTVQQDFFIRAEMSLSLNSWRKT